MTQLKDKVSHGQTKRKVKSQKKTFLDSFSSEIKQIPKVKKQHINRSKKAVLLLCEYMRLACRSPFSDQVKSKLQKYGTLLLRMEFCDNKIIQNQVQHCEETLLNEQLTRTSGLNGIELCLLFQNSHFSRVRDLCDTVMSDISSKTVRSNGEA